MKNFLVMAALGFLVIFAYKQGKRYLLKPKINSGIPASDFEGMLPDGSTFSLSALRGHYILLDFWGSWCKPCRREHPELKSLYNELQNRKFSNARGFQIVSFGVERNAIRWEEAINEDDMSWRYHLVSTDLFDHPTVKAYKVRQIPTRFLIDPEGYIIAVDPSISQIKKELEQIEGE